MKHILTPTQEQQYSHASNAGFIPAQQLRRETLLRMPQKESEAWERQRREHNGFWAKVQR